MGTVGSFPGGKAAWREADHSPRELFLCTLHTIDQSGERRPGLLL